MKIVINTCFGGFSISDKALERYAELKGLKITNLSTDSFPQWYIDGIKDNDHYLSTYDISRTDPQLIQVVEELGEEANGSCASLKIVDIPDDVQWEIQNYDGSETIAEAHRSWS